MFSLKPPSKDTEDSNSNNNNSNEKLSLLLPLSSSPPVSEAYSSHPPTFPKRAAVALQSHWARFNAPALFWGRLAFVVCLGVAFLIWTSLGSGSGLRVNQNQFSYASQATSSSSSSSSYPDYTPLPSLSTVDLSRYRDGPRELFSEPLHLGASLHDRIRLWEMSPLLDNADSIRWNRETMESVCHNHNNDLNNNNGLEWSMMNASFLMSKRQGMITYLLEQEASGALDPASGNSNLGKGRGIVFTAGNKDTVERAWICISMLRTYLNCHLPVELFYYKGEQPSERDIKRFRLLNAEFRHVDLAKSADKNKNFQIKSSALVQSSFREVLYLDSDNVPAKNPEYLFETPAYKRTGMMLWPDYWKTSVQNPVWQILGIHGRDMWETEAGQIVVDKSKNLDALILADYMNIHWKFFYGISDGDKDTFPFAMLALRKRWAVPGRYVGIGGLPGPTNSGDFCGLSMIQHDHVGDAIFIHSNLLKQVPSGIYRGFTWGRTKQLKTFPHLRSTKSNPFKNEIPEGELGNLDVDHLTNVDAKGVGLKPAGLEVRARAALEKGIRINFHGGGNSALCIDGRYDEFRNDDEKKDKDKDIKWSWKDPMEILNWKDVPYLAQFEDNMYDLGFSPTGN